MSHLAVRDVRPPYEPLRDPRDPLPAPREPLRRPSDPLREPRDPRLSDSRARLDVLPTTDPGQPASGFDLLFVNARDALVLADVASSRVTRWNPAAEVLFGYSPSQAVGRPVEMLMPPAVARLHRERVGHYLRTGDTDMLATRAPLAVPPLTASGQQIRVEMSMLPMEAPAPGSRVFSILFIFRDAGSEARAELSVLEAARAEAARKETEARLRGCEALLRQSPRELEWPVTRARRAAARMARVAARSEGATRLALLARVLECHLEDLQRSLDQMSDTADIETGAFDVRTERVNLVPLVSRVVASARTRSSAHRLNVGAPQGLTAVCDARRIESVVQDLIARAIRRNPRGGWIDVDLRRPLGGVARIEVRDYGRPISVRERERFTNPATADRGWNVNRHVIERHGGTLTVEFPSDGGMRVTISLPTHGSRLAAAM